MAHFFKLRSNRHRKNQTSFINFAPLIVNNNTSQYAYIIPYNVNDQFGHKNRAETV